MLSLFILLPVSFSFSLRFSIPGRFIDMKKFSLFEFYINFRRDSKASGRAAKYPDHASLEPFSLSKLSILAYMVQKIEACLGFRSVPRCASLSIFGPEMR